MNDYVPDPHERLLADPARFTPHPESWNGIAARASNRVGVSLRAETALWVAIELSLERYWHQPQETNHLRDAASFLAVLAHHVDSSREQRTRIEKELASEGSAS